MYLFIYNMCVFMSFLIGKRGFAMGDDDVNDMFSLSLFSISLLFIYLSMYLSKAIGYLID